MEHKLTDSSKLEIPHAINADLATAKRSFYELARSRIRYQHKEDHFAFEKTIFGDSWKRSSAVYILQHGLSREGSDKRKWITALEISVNIDFFGRENADLIPYAVEHEIYEAWLWSKSGYSPQSSEINHLLARRRQFELAMKDGKAEKLLYFYKKVNPEMASEFDYIYNKLKPK